jgi:sugar O-acyltransferase (sialic acid O-acetyltransferase NeuD family)
MKDLVLIGGGGHCKSVIDVIESAREYRIAGIIDIPSKIGEKVMDYRIIGTDADIEKLSSKYRNYCITLGHIKSCEARKRIFGVLKKLEVELPVIISPLAHVAASARIGEGTVIMHHALVNSAARIGVNSIINNKALIEHDVIVGDHCHVAPGAVINGGVVINNESFIGSGAVCVQQTEIPEGSFIKASSLFKG